MDAEQAITAAIAELLRREERAKRDATKARDERRVVMAQYHDGQQYAYGFAAEILKRPAELGA